MNHIGLISLLTAALISLGAPSAHSQGSLLLVGGGSEDYGDWSDQPYRWLVEQSPDKSVLVLDYSSGSSWLENYFRSLGATRTSSLSINSVAVANDSATYRAIVAYSGLFLRGGDQWQYVRLWKGSLAEQAIRKVFQSGGVVGGTSAGEVVLGEVVFDARLASVDPRKSLRDPLGASITFTDDFLALAPNILADSHFFERGRLGRLAPMISLYRKSTGKKVIGIGIEYGTALAVGSDGIGEVMGSGPVTILRFTPDMADTLEGSRPYALRNMGLDLLVAGSRINLKTGVTTRSSAARPWVPRPLTGRTPRVLLDGSADTTDWFSVSGSFGRFCDILDARVDTVGIITGQIPDAGAMGAARYVSQGRSVSVRVFQIGIQSRNDLVAATQLGGCSGLVFMHNSQNDRRWLFHDSTAVGRAIRSAAFSSKALLFAGDDVLLAGEKGVGQLYASRYGAYYGYLTLTDGFGLLGGLICMPRIYDQADFVDNRLSGLLWAMGTTNLPVGIALDAGSYAVIEDGQITVFGSTPALVIDARSANYVDFPTFRDPGKAEPRQIAGFIGARLHAVRSTSQFRYVNPTSARLPSTESATPSNAQLHQNFPNPFNPSTEIIFTLNGRSRATLRLYDMLGREVVTLLDEEKSAGRHRVTWEAGKHASGVYYYRLVAGDFVQTRKLVLLK